MPFVMDLHYEKIIDICRLYSIFKNISPQKVSYRFIGKQAMNLERTTLGWII